MTEGNTLPKILYVEDNEMQQQVVIMILKREGFEVRTAFNGQEGVDIAVEWLPDLILMDLMMPIMDGFQATEVLKKNPLTQDIPIVALTARHEADIPDRAKAVGMVDVVRKTHPPPVLVQAIQTQLRKT